MNGLFTRLAQQYITHRSSGIMPAPSPVFPTLHGELSVDVAGADGHRDQAPPPRIPESDAQIKIADTVLKYNPVRGVSDSPSVDGPATERQEEDAVVPPSLKPVIESVNTARDTQEEIRPLSAVAPSSPPEVQSSIQPQLEESHSLLKPLVSVEGKAAGNSPFDELESSPVDNPVAGRSLESHQVRPSRSGNRSVQSTEKFARRKRDETQTTINVSIGQVEIRATTPEKLEKNVTTRSDRTRSNALEEYHQKRLRGER